MGNERSDRCAQCGKTLIFSARKLGTGLCHFCGHKQLPKLRAEVERLQAELAHALQEWSRASRFILDIKKMQ